MLRSGHPFSNFFLTLPKKFCPQRVGWDTTNKGAKNFQPVNEQCRDIISMSILSIFLVFHLPFSLFFVGVSKEYDLLILREYQAERAFHTIETIIFVGISPCSPGCRTLSVVTSLLVVLNGNCLLQINGCSSLLCHIIKSDEIRANDP